MQLQGHAQVQIPIQRVMPGGERTSGCAAGDGLHDRRFHFGKSAAGEKLPQRRNHAGAALEHLARIAVHDQIDIAAAITLFAVGKPVKLLRQRTQGLGQQGHLAHFNAQLAGSRAYQDAARPNDIAQIQARGLRVGVLAHRVAREHELEPAAAILDRGETQAAHAALRNQASRHLHLPGEFAQRRRVRFLVFRLQFGGRGVRTVVIGKRPAGFPERLEFAPALRDQPVFGCSLGRPVVGRRGHGRIVRREVEWAKPAQSASVRPARWSGRRAGGRIIRSADLAGQRP